MHPVIKHLKARAGRAGPFADGRKIALVLWGGIMRAVRSGGAMVALQEMGLGQAFDSIYSVSAGFPVAAYFLSGRTRLGMELFYEELRSPRFLNRFRFWHGMDVSYLIRAMRHGKPLDVNAIFAGATRLYVRVVNFQSRKLEYFEIRELGQAEFWPLVGASVLVPILCRSRAKIKGEEYTETNLNAHLKEHIRHVLKTEHTDILVIYNSRSQRRIKLEHNPRVLEIFPEKNWKLSRFEKDPNVLRTQGQYMADLVCRVFEEKNIRI